MLLYESTYIVNITITCDSVNQIINNLNIDIVSIVPTPIKFNPRMDKFNT